MQELLAEGGPIFGPSLYESPGQGRRVRFRFRVGCGPGFGYGLAAVSVTRRVGCRYSGRNRVSVTVEMAPVTPHTRGVAGLCCNREHESSLKVLLILHLHPFGTCRMHRPNVNCPVGAGMICYCSFGSVSRSVHAQVSIQRRPHVLAPVWSWSHVFVSCLYIGFRMHASAFAASTRFFLYQHLLMQCICRMAVHKAPTHVVNLITGCPAGSHN